MYDFNISFLFSGNEARHFTLKNYTTQNIDDGAAPTTVSPPVPLTVNNTEYYPCDSPSVLGESSSLMFLHYLDILLGKISKFDKFPEVKNK